MNWDPTKICVWPGNIVDTVEPSVVAQLPVPTNANELEHFCFQIAEYVVKGRGVLDLLLNDEIGQSGVARLLMETVSASHQCSRSKAVLSNRTIDRLRVEGDFDLMIAATYAAILGAWDFAVIFGDAGTHLSITHHRRCFVFARAPESLEQLLLALGWHAAATMIQPDQMWWRRPKN